MDLVVRRQSEQLHRRHFSESLDDDDDDDDNGKPNNKKFREIYDYRRWEWGNLRVFHLILFIHIFFFFFIYIFGYSKIECNFIAKFLQTECENLGLEKFYRTYVQRLQRSYLSMFFVMHTIIAMVHTIVLVATQVSLLSSSF